MDASNNQKNETQNEKNDSGEGKTFEVEDKVSALSIDDDRYLLDKQVDNSIAISSELSDLFVATNKGEVRAEEKKKEETLLGQNKEVLKVLHCCIRSTLAVNAFNADVAGKFSRLLPKIEARLQQNDS